MTVWVSVNGWVGECECEVSVSKCQNCGGCCQSAKPVLSNSVKHASQPRNNILKCAGADTCGSQWSFLWSNTRFVSLRYVSFIRMPHNDSALYTVHSSHFSTFFLRCQNAVNFSTNILTLNYWVCQLSEISKLNRANHAYGWIYACV